MQAAAVTGGPFVQWTKMISLTCTAALRMWYLCVNTVVNRIDCMNWLINYQIIDSFSPKITTITNK